MKMQFRTLLWTAMFTFSFMSAKGRSSVVEIGLLTDMITTTIIVTPITEEYSVLVNDSLIHKLSTKDLLHIALKDGLLELKTMNSILGTFPNVSLVPANNQGTFKLKPVVPYGHTRTYDETLRISVKDSRLHVINDVNIDKYVAGVVRSEVGTNEGIELYKVQAIICRTYALSSFRKHEDDDYQLCDKVHCQVFGGLCDQADPLTGASYAASDDILQAALQTSGLVLVDTALELITASFHSNCGGQTANSGDVWMLSKPYLRSVKDTFCLRGKNVRWEYEINSDKWLGYLKKVYGYPVDDATYRERALNFTQSSRAVYFQNNPHILLKDIRAYWKLRSSFFSISTSGNKVLFQGRGYGHGVGLCQEGAMAMAARGMTYKEILHFYYEDVALIDIATLRYLLK